MLRLATICAPPKDQDAIMHMTKANAQASEEHFDGTHTEPKATSKAKQQPRQAKAVGKQATAKPAAKRPTTRARAADTD